MFDFHEKRKIRRVLYSKIFIGFIFLIVFVIGQSVYERYTVEREMAQKLNDRTAELDALRTRAALLESKVEHLKNERGIEEEIRGRFDVVRGGEQVVIILDEDEGESSDTIPQKSTTTPSEKKGVLERLKFW